MPEKIELSSESVNKAKQMALDFKNALISNFKDLNVEVKEWKFAVESIEDCYNIDAAVKIQLKSKSKTK